MSGAAWWPAHENTLDLALGIYQGPTGSGPYQLPDNGQETYEHGGLIVYDPIAKIMTNASTPVNPINEGGLVHLTS